MRAAKQFPNLEPSALQATLDGRPVDLSLLPGRPSIALAAAFLLDSSASPQVRDALANALAEGVQGLDVNRDTVAIVSTADTPPLGPGQLFDIRRRAPDSPQPGHPDRAE